MKNKIFCAIDSSLVISLPKDIPNFSFKKVDSNEALTSDSFSLLVLNKGKHSLYSEKRFTSEEKFDAIAYYDTDAHKPQDIVAVCNVFDHIITHPGILSHKQILILMNLGILIYDGEPDRVKGASYDLLIDKEHLKSGIKVKASDSFQIDPLDYVIVGAVESANIPKNICASFDTKVSMFCRGIILSNGPQVDPGYQGRLLCLLFNTSAKPFDINPVSAFEFSTVQFNTLAESTNKPYKGKYLRKQSLKDYINPFADQSIAGMVKTIPEMSGTIQKLQKDYKKLEKKRFSKSDLILSFIFGLLVAAITAGIYFATLDARLKNVEDALINRSEVKKTLSDIQEGPLKLQPQDAYRDSKEKKKTLEEKTIQEFSK